MGSSLFGKLVVKVEISNLNDELLDLCRIAIYIRRNIEHHISYRHGNSGWFVYATQSSP